MDINCIVGLKEIIKKSLFNIFPNPANTKFTLELTEDIEKVEIRITNLLGQEIKTFKLFGNKLEVQISDLNNGIYFIDLIKANQIISSTKLIKE